MRPATVYARNAELGRHYFQRLLVQQALTRKSTQAEKTTVRELTIIGKILLTFVAAVHQRRPYRLQGRGYQLICVCCQQSNHVL